MRSILLLATLLFFAAFNSFAQGIQITDPIRFLALGDSYTIGESVPETERWPVQFVEALKALGVTHQSTKIIATTGWRTDNLQTAIDQQNLQPDYNLVGLLIGVNNQYQHKPISQYYTEF